MRNVIALDIGGTKIVGALVAFGSAGEVLAQRVSDFGAEGGLCCWRAGDAVVVTGSVWSVPTPHSGGVSVVAAVVSVAQLVADFAARSGLVLSGVGIGSAGVVDPSGRMIVSATDAIPGWAGTALADLVQAQLSLPVVVENDVHSHARGEVFAGGGAGASSALMVAVGTGIGGAFVSGSEILRGANGLAGHVGHIVAPGARGCRCSCGADGHLEAIASGPGMTSWFVQRGGSAVDARDLEAQAEAGDVLAVRVLSEAAAATGAVLAGLVNCFDPEVVILGGGLARAGDLYWGPLREAFAQQLMPPLRGTPLVSAVLGSGAALVGAAVLVDCFLDDSGEF